MDEPLRDPNEPPRRSLIQRLLLTIFPASWSESMIAESKGWKARCLTCEHPISIWALGGVRWKASSRYKRIMIRCPNCQAARWAAVEWAPDADGE